MSTRWMPWRCVPMKDGAPLRYAAGSRQQAVIRRSPNGATHRFGGTAFGPRAPGELKHLSSRRKRERHP